MIKNNFGESLIGVIIGIFILSFIVLGITNLLINSKNIINTYENKKIINLIKNNSENILKKINTEDIQETEVFYLYKDIINKEFVIFTGSTNVGYKYIDEFGNKIDNLESFDGDIYSRIFWAERDDNSLGNNHQIIKMSIKKLLKN
ncbi:MAG: hypothetical protein Q8K30_05920 [Candidatus Gracilibacteria bacterium]|nr:hypothetical protein [Candidatus Gracilibacteria bacterium]